MGRFKFLNTDKKLSSTGICLNNGCLGVIQRMKDTYSIEFNVPLDVELKVGSDWLNTNLYA